MKQATVCDDAGAEVGCSLVLEARSLVGPGVPRAPRIAAATAHLRFRRRGLHASVREGEVSWRSCIRGVPGSVSRFPSVGHLISWAGFCPRLDESAGKRRSTRTRQTSPWLKPTLINAAWAATRKKDSYLRAQFPRIKSRRGAKKAVLAVASSMLTAPYFMLRDGVEYHDLGSHHFEQRDKEQLACGATIRTPPASPAAFRAGSSH
jgi:transposase